jgi:hypothetical protein
MQDHAPAAHTPIGRAQGLGPAAGPLMLIVNPCALRAGQPLPGH